MRRRTPPGPWRPLPDNLPLFVGLALLGAASAVLAPPARGAGETVASPAAVTAYQSIFGADERAALASRSPKDSARFALKLASKGKELTDDPDLATLIYQKVTEFGAKDPEGYDAAIGAARKLIELRPANKDFWRQKLIDLYRLAFRQKSGAERTELGNSLVDELIDDGDSLVKGRHYADAVKRYRDATTFASSVRSPRQDELGERIHTAQSQQQAWDELTKIQADLAARPGSPASPANPMTSTLAERAIALYVAELDDPAGASASGVAQKATAKTRALVALAAKSQDELGEPDLMQMATWYKSLAEKASPAGKSTALERAQDYARKFLSLHTKRDADYLRVAEELALVNKALDALPTSHSGAGDRLRIWNQHNGTANDRGTTEVNVVLLMEGRPVWHKEGLPMEWKQSTDTHLDVPLPGARFDKVRVEMVAWQGEGPGLAEIEVLHGKTNVALGAAVKTSDPHPVNFPAATLTDGITSSAEYGKGYWLGATKKPAWAEVDLAAKVEPAGARPQRR